MPFNNYGQGQTQLPVQQTPQNMYPQILAYVHGLSGANAYPLGPNAKALLMDLDEDVMYIKSTDPLARPYPIEAYDIVKKEIPDTSAVTRDEYNRLVKMLEEQKQMLEDLTK